MTSESFKTLEHAGWVEKADSYDQSFAKITDLAITPILDTFGGLASKRLLDLACGPGHIAANAATRGAISEGIDFASTMVEKARLRYPGVTFREGDAEQLPYDDACFDAVACGFGLLHMAQPERAIAEAFRVLKSGGRFTFSVWCSPDQGGAFFKLVMEAVQKRGTLDVPLPPAPPIFKFSDPNESIRALTAAGFIDAEVTVLPLTWRTLTPDGVLELIYKGAVRTPMILNAQSPEARAAIHRAILEESEAFRKGDAIELSFPASISTARKI